MLQLQAALQLTEAQQVKMMETRRLFYAKLGAIRRQRKKLLQQVPAGVTETSYDASSRLSTITGNAQLLQENSTAELTTYFHVSAYLRLSSEQKGVRRW